MRLPHWPARWKQRGKTIYYRTKPEERDRFDGKHWYPLGKTEEEAFARWCRFQTGVVVPRTILDAINLYQASDRFQGLAPKTQKEYRKVLKRLKEVFGRMRPQDVVPGDIYQYMRGRPLVSGNRERAVMLNVMQLCVEYGAIERNPVREVRQNREKARDRYVTDDEVAAFLRHATPLIKAYVNLKLLTGARQAQLLALTRQDWCEETGSLFVPGLKYGRDAIYTGPGLREAIYQCLKVRTGKFESMYLFCTRRGKQYTGDGFRSLWSYAMGKYLEAGGKRFTEHDLRAKVASDSEDLDVAQARLQHQSRTTTNRVYRRAPTKVKVLRRKPVPDTNS